MEVKLQFPITWRGQTYSALKLRRPLVRDNLVAQKVAKGDVGLQEIHLIALMAEVDPDMFGELAMSDYRQLQGALAFFLSPPPQSSDVSSGTSPATTTGA